jgi:hypothetical protein
MKKWLICVILVIGFTFAQNHNTFGQFIDFPDTSGWYWRVWHVAGTPDTVVLSHTVDINHPLAHSFWFAGPPPFAVWNFDFGNWPAPAWANGDRLLYQADFDSAFGEITHKGFYGICNDTLDATQNPQTLLPDTLRSIPQPAPVAWDSVHDDTFFISVDTIRLAWNTPIQTVGNPPTGNVIGYMLYRDTSGTGQDDTLSDGSFQYFDFVKLLSDTTCLDSLPPGYDGHIYYCIKLMYRPDTMGLVFTSKFLSINSPTVFNTPVIGIADRSSSAQSYAIDIYPNPFTEKAEISLNIGHNTKNIELNIYDASGKLVRQFSLPPSRSSAFISLTWNGTDSGGEKLPSGTYFIEVKYDNAELTRKVILQR